ncbi:hypothetical protein F2Q69_00028158 [Brassica cretica]|uniref:RNase H type-1 domain-containing protein n=1 Tax=Brassica cretica TaxID=69181 RepID=A0A8S9RW80_BRACR|nr:hypothetical protein F2Q69_00028158 [Brassica cretica]
MEAKDGEKNRTHPMLGRSENINHTLFECPPALQIWALSPISSAPGVFPCTSCWVPSRWRKPIGFTEGIWISTVGSSVDWVLVKLVVTVLQQCCLECLVALCSLSLCSVQVVEQGGRGCTHIHLYSELLSGLRSRGFSFSHRGGSHKVRRSRPLHSTAPRARFPQHISVYKLRSPIEPSLINYETRLRAFRYFHGYYESWKLAQIDKILEEEDGISAEHHQTAPIHVDIGHRYKCQVDGSWSEKDKWMGMGFILLEAEEVILLQQQPIIVILNKIEWPSLAAELDEIKLLSTRLHDFVFTFIPRNLNFRADSLAKGSRSLVECFAIVADLAPNRYTKAACLNEPE